ncbi:MAG: periplasmic heavy metal sensor [Armatimonadetes bacterium]|nr:periplasmic heavy metal sensor [Armatimonadota bacterium]
MRRRVLLAAVVVALLALPALGQAPTLLPDERVGRIIEALLIWRLVDELELTDQQIARLFPRIKTLKEIRLELGRRKRMLEADLRQLLRQRPPDQEAIRLKLAELNDLRVEIERRRQQVLRQIASILTIEQQARFALIAERFEAETLRLLEEVRRLVEQSPRQ